MKLFLAVDLPSDLSRADARALSARLLRDAARRIETEGHDYGGFHYGRDESYNGAFLIGSFPWAKVGLNRPEPEAQG